MRAVRRSRAAHIAGARRFVGSKPCGRFGVVASAGSGSQGLLGAAAWELGQPIHVKKRKRKETRDKTRLKIDACAV